MDLYRVTNRRTDGRTDGISFLYIRYIYIYIYAVYFLEKNIRGFAKKVFLLKGVCIEKKFGLENLGLFCAT